MIRTAVTLQVVISSLCACDRPPGSTSTSPVVDLGGDVAPEEDHVVFSAREITPSPTRKGYRGLFAFSNNTRSTIRLPGLEGPHVGFYTADKVVFEVQDHEKWTQLDIGYCGFPGEVTVGPNSECLMDIDLFAFKEQSVAVVGRVRVGGYTSESFVLDWPTDRRKGRFKLAREEYLEKIRMQLRDAGFKESVTTGEDFCRRLLVTILSPLDRNDLGFAPFEGELDVVPVQISGGNLRFDFHGSVIIYYEYQYSGMLVVNPSTFTPAWYGASALSHAAIGNWGKARTLKVDDGSGFYTESNKLYLEIKYHVPTGKTLPDAAASQTLLSRVIGKLGDCLEARKE